MDVLHHQAKVESSMLVEVGHEINYLKIPRINGHSCSRVYKNCSPLPHVHVLGSMIRLDII